MKVSINGCNDDLIVLSGNIEREFSAYEKDIFLHFNDGTVVRCLYNSSYDEELEWQFDIIEQGKNCVYINHEPVIKNLPPEQYSLNSLELNGDFTEVECWSSKDGPTKDDLTEFFYSIYADEYELKTLYEAYKILQKRN
jgi:hypothetical protein